MRAYDNIYFTFEFSVGYTSAIQSLYHAIIEYIYLIKLWYCSVHVLFEMFMEFWTHF